MHRGSFALGGPQTDSSSVPDRLLVAKAAPEPDTDRRNLRSRKSHELGPIGPNMRARGSPRRLLIILAERTDLIAQEAPPRLGWPSAWCRQITRDGGLGNGVSEHEKLTVDPRGNPRESSHGPSVRSDVGLRWKPSGAHPASAPGIDIAKALTSPAPAQDRLGLDDDQAVAPLGPPTREQDPKQSIPKAKARATRSAALEDRNLMAQGDRFQQQRGAGSGFAAGERQCCVCRHRHKGRLSPDVRNHQPIRAD